MMEDRAELLKKVSEEQFAVVELKLYLDTHPDDMAAIQKYKEAVTAYLKNKAAFESKFGPLTADNFDGSFWDWTDAPWPWESNKEVK